MSNGVASDKTFWALSALLTVSIATNAYFVQRFFLPSWQHELRVWFAPTPVPNSSDHVRGDESSVVTIIEYGDFQCPYCARLHDVLREVTQTDDVRWIFRHFTLNAGHAEAPMAANAAECAGEQGHFWEYADALYASHANLSADVYAEIASSLQLDSDQFRSCLTATRHQPAIDADNAAADELEFLGVPTWFVNGKRLSGAMSLDEVRQIIDAARSSAKS